jgi:predicted dehydrogenase
MSMKPIKIAMMTLNHGHARGYYKELRNNPNFEWVAASVSPEDKDRVFLEMLKDIPQYESDVEMLDAHPEIEAVVLASANYLHYEQVKLCAQRGIHIFSMKVPTFDIDQYDEMIELTEKHNMVFQIELELRYSAVIKRIKQLYDSGAIGKLMSFQAVNTTHCPVWWLPWHGIPEQSYGRRIELRDGDGRFRGGALADHPHIFDMIRYITGSEFDLIFAEIAPNLRKELEVEDMLTIVGKMKDGTAFSLDPSFSRSENRMPVIGPGWELYPKRVEVNIILNGEKGTIMADCFGPNIYHTGLPNERYIIRYSCSKTGSNKMMMNEFADCIRNNKMPSINLLSHKKTIEAMNACYDSIAANSPIKL